MASASPVTKKHTAPVPRLDKPIISFLLADVGRGGVPPKGVNLRRRQRSGQRKTTVL
jgi:hypothetical protein